jgi:hypothetical protein
MPTCACEPVRWKNRSARCLTNGIVTLTTLLGGGHIADFRLCDSDVNVVWESPWPIIEPQSFSPAEHAAIYGDGAAARMLSGYTGHALVLGYFGMPSAEEQQRGLPLHGEPTTREWRVLGSRSRSDAASLTLEVDSPAYSLRFRRTLTLSAGCQAIRVEENVTNYGRASVAFQWVQHAAFGEPLLARHESSLVLRGSRCVTWPLGYEDGPLLADNADFAWPFAPAGDGGTVDLSKPFSVPHTGFVAAALLDPASAQSFVLVHNRRLGLIAGYSFERQRFPWVTLWEENHARVMPPWNGGTRVRGVEFGNSPMPLGLEWAKQNPTLFGAPTFSRIESGETVGATYHLFMARAESAWRDIADVRLREHELVISDRGGREIVLRTS